MPCQSHPTGGLIKSLATAASRDLSAHYLTFRKVSTPVMGSYTYTHTLAEKKQVYFYQPYNQPFNNEKKGSHTALTLRSSGVVSHHHHYYLKCATNHLHKSIVYRTSDGRNVLSPWIQLGYKNKVSTHHLNLAHPKTPNPWQNCIKSKSREKLFCCAFLFYHNSIRHKTQTVHSYNLHLFQLTYSVQYKTNTMWNMHLN